MRILIDASPLLLKSAGVKNYIYYWILALKAAASGERIQLFPFLGEFGSLDHEGSLLSTAATLPRLGWLYFVNIPGNPAIDWTVSGADVVHLTNQVRNPPRRARLTATVYDMTCSLMPEVHTAANVRADRAFAENVLCRASGLIAISESTKRDTVRILNLDPDTIDVIYPGVPERYFQVTADEVARVRHHYELGRPYILSVGTIEPRKNILGLVEAYLALPPSLKADVELVVAGPIGWSSGETHARLVSGLPGVRYIGYVPEADLPGLTAGAAVLAYPSLYEGFGFPVAQALACGVPVVVSNVSSLPEVAGGGGLLVDPRSAHELSAALDRVFSHAGLQKSLGEEGRRHAQQFRWSVCAHRSWEFFRKVVG